MEAFTVIAKSEAIQLFLRGPGLLRPLRGLAMTEEDAVGMIARAMANAFGVLVANLPPQIAVMGVL